MADEDRRGPRRFTPARSDPALGRATLRAEGATLVLGSEPFAALGANVWQLQEYFMEARPPSLTACGRTWEADAPGDAVDGRRILERAADHGLKVIRYITTGWNPVWLNVWATQPAAYWRAHDALLDAAHGSGRLLIPSLVWHGLPFSTLAGEERPSAFRRGTQAHDLLLRYVRAYVTRYRDHPALLMWELGNEWNLATARGRAEHRDFASLDELEECMKEIVAVIKECDPEHLVESGHAAPALDQGPDIERQQEAFVRLNRAADVASLHIYPVAQDVASALGTAPTKRYLQAMAAVAASELARPLIVGEFGESYEVHPGGTFVREVLESWAEGTMPLALVWSWMAAASSGAGQLASSVDPQRHPAAAALFKAFAASGPKFPPARSQPL